MDHSHRPGLLKQSNKAHKTGKHRSKGAINSVQRGRVSVHKISRKIKHVCKLQRKRNLQLKRKTKIADTVNQKRQLGSANAPPFLVCLLPMHDDIDPKSALEILLHCDPEASPQSVNDVSLIYVPRFKQRFSFIIPPYGRGNELAILDYLKVCDTTVLLTSAQFGEDELFDNWGYRIFDMIMAQGIPTPLTTLMNLESLNPKRRLMAKAAAQKFISKLLPDEKVWPLGVESDGLNILRRIGNQKLNILRNSAYRPHLFADILEFEPMPNSDVGTLKLTGYIRGKPFDVNSLVHVPGLGDFQLGQIDEMPEPFSEDKSLFGNPIQTIAKCDQEKQTSLLSEYTPDPMDAEQTWPTEQEIADAQRETKKTKLIRRVPKNYGEYQSEWIADIKEVEVEDDMDFDSEDNDEDDNGEDLKDNYQPMEEQASDDEFESHASDEEKDDDVDTKSMISAVDIADEKYDQQIDIYEEFETLKKIKEANTDRSWPDEIDTPLDQPAREIFKDYRGLESFRTSVWDKNENLPLDYARINRYKNFEHIKRAVIADIKNASWETYEQKRNDGTKRKIIYISLHIINVPAVKFEMLMSAQPSSNLIVFGLLRYEHQMTVMNVALKRMHDSQAPIQSGESLIMQCGYRRFVVNPVYSQHTKGKQHKMERFFQPHTTICATFYAPTQFPPAPVLAFKTNPDSTLALVAQGSLLSCDPDRIILERIVLSGYPMRIHRKSATIRYMFFNKEDIKYFKPVKLRTRCGRVGHITETLGTHGHMKCSFDGQLRSQDTVFMYLYKRVYPEYNYTECSACYPKTIAESKNKSSIAEMMDL